MKVTMLWHGGGSYGDPYPDDVERFESLESAIREFRRRLEGGDRYYPMVDEASHAEILRGHHTEILEPDYILSVGPRGGIHVNRYR